MTGSIRRLIASSNAGRSASRAESPRASSSAKLCQYRMTGFADGKISRRHQTHPNACVAEHPPHDIDAIERKAARRICGERRRAELRRCAGLNRLEPGSPRRRLP